MNSRHDPSNNGTRWHLVEERIRADEREKVLSEVEEIVPEWIDNPLGEVNDYTIGRRDERKEIRTKLAEMKKGE